MMTKYYETNTLPRVICVQSEDCENRKKGLAPLPAAYNKTSTGSHGVSFCGLSQYNLRHQGDFSIPSLFLRNPKHWRRTLPWWAKNLSFGVNIS